MSRKIGIFSFRSARLCTGRARSIEAFSQNFPTRNDYLRFNSRMYLSSILSSSQRHFQTFRFNYQYRVVFSWLYYDDNFDQLYLLVSFTFNSRSVSRQLQYTFITLADIFEILPKISIARKWNKLVGWPNVDLHLFEILHFATFDMSIFDWTDQSGKGYSLIILKILMYR